MDDAVEIGVSMGRKDKSHRQRDAVSELVDQLGISRREAGNLLRGDAVGDLRAPAEIWASAPELVELIEAATRAGELELESFTPFHLVEGHIEQQLLIGFRVGEVSIEDAYVEDKKTPQIVGVDLIAEGTGDVHWYVTQPSAGDVEAHGSRMEGIEDGPGLWQEVDEVVPVHVRLHARYDRGTVTWSEVEVGSAAIDEAEAAQRSRAHEAEDTRRQQALGLLPSDDEIQAMADKHEREHFEALTDRVERLLDGIDRDVLRDDFVSG